MIQLGNFRSSAVVIAVVAALLLPAPLALGADPREVEELRGEIRQLQAQVQTLRSVMSELAEVDRHEYYVVTRAPGSQSAPEPTPAPLVATTEPREPSPARVSPDTTERPSRSSKSRRHRHSSRSRSKSGRSSANR